ncbi:MAG: AtpZ/AtpI family protein [Chitinophagales bacterium]
MEKKETSNIKKPSKQFIKYTALGSQMLIVIVLGIFLGKYIDESFNGEGLYLAFISLFFVVASIYLGIKDLIKTKK